MPAPASQAEPPPHPEHAQPTEAEPTDVGDPADNHPGPLGGSSDEHDKLLASTASLPSELLRTAYLVDTGTQITLVCSKENLTDIQPLDRPLI